LENQVFEWIKVIMQIGRKTMSFEVLKEILHGQGSSK
jgi:hypothetical protein